MRDISWNGIVVYFISVWFNRYLKILQWQIPLFQRYNKFNKKEID